MTPNCAVRGQLAGCLKCRLDAAGRQWLIWADKAVRRVRVERDAGV